MSHELDAGTPMGSAAPIAPEQRSSPNRERVQEHAHLARLDRGTAIPLALLAQSTGTATADAGSIDHTQAAVNFSAPLVREQLLVGGATQRAIRLESEIPSRKAANFEGDGNRGLAIACGWGLLLFGLGQSSSKFGRAYGSRL
jgi:hypothetical protein